MKADTGAKFAEPILHNLKDAIQQHALSCPTGKLSLFSKDDTACFHHGTRSSRFTRVFPADLRWWLGGVQLALLFCIGTKYAAAQAAAEYGHISAAVSAAGSKALSTPKDFKDLTLSTNQPGATAMPARPDSAGEGNYRKELEARAGKDAAKLMLRSVPPKAWVRIDGKPVGETPLLLIVAPGVYVVEMQRGARMDSARRQVDLLPKETREVVLTLESRYPTRVSVPSPSSR